MQGTIGIEIPLNELHAQCLYLTKTSTFDFMKFKIVTFFLLSCSLVFAQHKVVVFYLTPAIAEIKNDNYANDQFNQMQHSISPEVGVSQLRYFSKNMAFSFGIKYAAYKNTLISKNYFKSNTTKTDSYGDEYYPVVISGYTLKRQMLTLEVPLTFHYEKTLVDNARYFCNVGFKLTSPIVSKKEFSGYYETMGFYQHPYYTNIGLLVGDDPSNGFKKTTYENSTGFKYKNISASLCSNIGLIIPMNKNVSFMCSLEYVLGLTDINETEKGKNYVNLKGDISPYKPSKISAIGFRFGIGLSMFTE